MTCTICCIVEGHGEVSSVPILIRRIAELHNPGLTVNVPRPLRVPADRLRQPLQLERYVELAARQVGSLGGILVLLDADDDDDCPARLGPRLLARCIAQRTNVPVSVVLAKREFEAWFLVGQFRWPVTEASTLIWSVPSIRKRSVGPRSGSAVRWHRASRTRRPRTSRR